MNVVSLIQRIEQREQDQWDREARTLGFKDFAALQDAEADEFDTAWSELERNCTHPDKLPELNVCERCAESFRL